MLKVNPTGKQLNSLVFEINMHDKEKKRILLEKKLISSFQLLQDGSCICPYMLLFKDRYSKKQNTMIILIQ